MMRTTMDMFVQEFSQKMENKTFNSNDLKDFKIEKEDFDKAIDDFMKDRKSNTRKPIGYNKQ